MEYYYFFVWMLHKFHANVSPLHLSKPLVEPVPLSFVTVTPGLSNSFPLIPSRHPIHCFLLIHSWPVLQTMLCGLPLIFFVYFSLIFSVELFCSSFVTVTQGSCNIFPLFPNLFSTLLFPFELFITSSHNNVI